METFFSQYSAHNGSLDPGDRYALGWDGGDHSIRPVTGRPSLVFFFLLFLPAERRLFLAALTRFLRLTVYAETAIYIVIAAMQNSPRGQRRDR